MKKSKFLSLIMMLICAIIFTGCQKGDLGQTFGGEDSQKPIFEQAAVENDRYAEKEIDLPEEFLQNDEKVLSFIQNEKDEFELYGSYMGNDELPIYTKYTLADDGTWGGGSTRVVE